MQSFFRSLSSFFSSGRQGPLAGSSKQPQFSSNDAFSLPTHSPSTDQLSMPRSAGFTYPPHTPASAADDVTPFSSTDRVNRVQGASTLLPTHHSSSSSKSYYPPLDKTWARIRAWLLNEYTELGDTLNYGILPESLAEIETKLGFQLPKAVRDSYLIVDGQEAESSAGCSEGLFFGLHFLPLEEVLAEWRFWREVDDDPATGANSQIRAAMQTIPVDWIRKEYSSRGWIPLISDKVGNYIGIDINPGPKGSAGQVIVFGRDFDTKIVLWNGNGQHGWARWLASFAEELEGGEGFEVRGPDGDNSDDGSEDSIGYEGYFNGGVSGGKGDTGGPGGLRFTGEYKGWNAIEVWADRSYKAWYEAGLVPEGPDDEGTTEVPSSSAAPNQNESVRVETSDLTDVSDPTADETTPIAAVISPARIRLPISPSKAGPTTSDPTAADLLSLTSPSPLDTEFERQDASISDPGPIQSPKHSSEQDTHALNPIVDQSSEPSVKSAGNFGDAAEVTGVDEFGALEGKNS
ncbi:uncharacterized protein EI90DRAFT_3125625 [Cantharellus anzutake]|uniref:uncharacterized protein n=1 Tax=Cantharellus anzutake TaxID=1750568 RepID=UPI001905A683|nr:uncharacterized protein EI90DRAFT_3125625 [Cantharellus anzutake]KAF8328885.1 hypothetical protein EI90DRAFT_3125625 [Cantharellus anzutake]